MVTARYFPLMGGTESHVYEVARRLVHQGMDVTVLTTDRSGDLPTYERVDGVAIERVRAYPADRDYYVAPALYHRITQGRWDLVHVQGYQTFVAPLAMLAAWRAGIPYVLTFHGGGHSLRWRNAIRGLQLRLLQPLLARAQRLIAVAQFEVTMYGTMLGIRPDCFIVIPNGADLVQADEVIDGQASDPNLIASIGRLERYKGHHRVIAALPTVLGQRPDARLWIAGHGSYEPELRQLAQDLKIADRVDIRPVPPTERAAMARELSKAALVTLFSDFETHPVAALEAAALGKSLLVSDTSGLSELASQGLARAIPLQSTPEQIGRAILEQLESPFLPASTNIPTWDMCAQGLIATYNDIFQER
jgi:glycogen synthase